MVTVTSKYAAAEHAYAEVGPCTPMGADLAIRKGGLPFPGHHSYPTDPTTCPCCFLGCW